MRCSRATLLLVLLSVLPCVGCATTVGTVSGPVTGPVTFWRHTYGTPPWLKAVLTPFLVPVGPIIGFYAGVRADVGRVAYGDYGIYPGPPFDIVFDPANSELERPGMDNSYGHDPQLDAYVKWGSIADTRKPDPATSGSEPK